MMNFNRDAGNGCPCKECPEKGCGAKHDTCEQYTEWQKQLEKRNAAERNFHKGNDTISDAKKRDIWRGKRYSRRLWYNRNGTKSD